MASGQLIIIVSLSKGIQKVSCHPGVEHIWLLRKLQQMQQSLQIQNPDRPCPSLQKLCTLFPEKFLGKPVPCPEAVYLFLPQGQRGSRQTRQLCRLRTGQYLPRLAEGKGHLLRLYGLLLPAERASQKLESHEGAVHCLLKQFSCLFFIGNGFKMRLDSRAVLCLTDRRVKTG